MDKALFQFDSNSYDKEDVINLSRKMCETLCVKDEYNVCKYDLDTYPIEVLLNNDDLDTTNCWYRVFDTEESC